MKQAIRPAIFKWRQTEPELIVCAVRWYLRYSLSFRDVEELLRERGLEADHTTIWRWVQRYGPELEERLRRHLKPTNKSWRVDETYVRVKGRWCYLYRAIDSTGATINFVLSGLRDAATANRLFRKALTDPSHPQPRVINTDQARLYGSAISGVKKEGLLRRRCRHRPVQYVNNILEQDHRAIKRRVKAKQGFREFQAARRTLQGYEAMHMIRKGQARWMSGFGCAATDSVHQQLVRGGGMRRSPADSTNRSFAAFGKLQHILPVSSRARGVPRSRGVDRRRCGAPRLESACERGCADCGIGRFAALAVPLVRRGDRGTRLAYRLWRRVQPLGSRRNVVHSAADV